MAGRKRTLQTVSLTYPVHPNSTKGKGGDGANERNAGKSVFSVLKPALR